MTRRKTHEQFALEMAALHPSIDVLGSYATAQTKVDCRCKKCSYIWSPRPSDLLKGQGCPKCAGKAKKTDAEFRAEMETIAPSIEVLEPYKGTMEKLDCECRVCGHRWKVTPNHLLRGSGCPKCNGNYKRSTDEFVHDLAAANPAIVLLGDYVDTQTKTQFKCITCGHEWSAKPIRLLRGDGGCPQCGLERVKRKLKKGQSDFVAQLKEVNPSVTVLGEYVNSREPLKCRCDHCGNEWSAAPHALLNGTGCPRCNHTSTSYAEQFILSYLRRLIDEASVLSRDRNLIGMELDIAIPSKAFAMEVGSWYWHAEKKSRDMLKLQLCRQKGIRLLTIYDAFPSSEERPQLEDCLIYEENLGEYKNRDLLKNLVISIAAELNLDGELPESEWSSISDEAYNNSRSKTTESYSQELASFNPDVEVIGDYKGSHIKVLCRCRVCGHEWKTKPANLSQGRGCPLCGRKKAADARRKSHEEFVSSLKTINPNIAIFSEYAGNKIPVECSCLVCGYRWNGTPSSLLNGTGCPNCAGNMKKTHEVFAAEMAVKHPTIRVCGTYIGADAKIECQCLICGCKWKGIPAQMLSAGTGCPACGREKVARKLRKSPEQFLSELSAVNPTVEVIGPYVNSSTKVKCRCKNCGHTWSAVPGSLLRGHGCPNCAKRIRAIKQTKSADVFLLQLRDVNPGIKPVGEYAGSSEKIECECLACGYHWSPIASNILNGAGCPKCAGKARKTTAEFVDELSQKNPQIEVLGEYVSSKTKILCRCKTCGNQWSPIPNNLLRGAGCPSCARRKNKAGMR